MSVLIFILVLSFLVLIHELGHYFAAKWAKVKVDEFGLGYPPKALTLFRYKGTDFTLNWVPFGGFVRMQGEEDSLEESKSTQDKKSMKGQFYNATPVQKLVIILAGATVNFIFGIIAFTVVFTKLGIPVEIQEARIGQVVENSPAARAGIQPSTTITAIKIADDVVAVSNPTQVIELVQAHRGETIALVTTGKCSGTVCQEIAQEFSVYVRTVQETPAGQGALGIAFDSFVFESYPLWQMPFRSTVYGIEQAFQLGWQILLALSGLMTDLLTRGIMPKDIAGPIGIVHQAQTSGLFEQGFLTIFSFAGMLSINLAVMNVLPLPPLDGGRAVFIVLETLFTRKKTAKIEGYFNYIGYLALLGLILLITIRDVLRLFGI